MMRCKKLILCVVVLLSIFSIKTVYAHAFDPSLLTIKKVTDKEWELYWRKPDLNGTPLPIGIVLPSSCLSSGKRTTSLQAAVWVSQWRVTCDPFSFSKPLVISGLERVDVSVVVRYWPGSGETYQTHLIQSDNPSITLEADSSIGSTFTTYAFLGFEHILEGWDHLLFLFALILLIRRQRQLIIAITAFTLAHSITLFAATMNLINLNFRLVEAVIAFSIVFLAYEVVKDRSDKISLTKQYPWMVTFTFGLLHGFGFAGALREIGIPQDEIPMTLFAFNVGVELGQIVFLMGAYLVTILVSRWFENTLKISALFTKTCAYFVGSASSFWLIERIIL